MAPFIRRAPTLTWPEDHELHGLEVKMKRPSVYHIEEAAKIDELDESEVSKVITLLADLMGPSLLRWNYSIEDKDDDGNPITVALPSNAEGIRRAEMDVLMEIMGKWMDTMEVSDPLSQPSSSSPSSLAESATMDPLLANLGSLPMLAASTLSSNDTPDTPTPA